MRERFPELVAHAEQKTVAGCISAAVLAQETGALEQARQHARQALELVDGMQPEASALLAHLELSDSSIALPDACRSFAALCRAVCASPENAMLVRLFWRYAIEQRFTEVAEVRPALHALFRVMPDQALDDHKRAVISRFGRRGLGAVHFSATGAEGWMVGADVLDIEIDGKPSTFPLDARNALQRFSFTLPPGTNQIRLGGNGHELAGSPWLSPDWQPGQIGTSASPDDASIHILIPAYRGLEHLQSCLESIYRSTNRTRYLVWVVNDASPDEQLGAYLRKQAEKGSIRLIERRINTGFVGAVNTGLRAIPAGDVILLNADVRVHGDWIDRLVAIARHPDVGTVTPMSNNAELLSHPVPMKANPTPDDRALARLDDCFKRYGDKAPLDIPAGVGFCLYLTRRAIASAGGLDERLIRRGYGEDTDYCLRVRAAGLRNVAARNVYVAHAGGGSFGAEKKALAMENLARLHAKYPDHPPRYDRFLQDDPCAALRERIQRKMTRKSYAAQAITPKSALAPRGENARGALLEWRYNFVIGWALPMPDGTPAIVEIRLDDKTAAIVQADLTLPEGYAHQVPANARGFVIHLPESAIRQAHRISARLANLAESDLSGHILLDRPVAHPLPAKHTAIGMVESHGGLRLWGWARSLTAPGTSVAVQVFDGDRFIAETIADLPRPDLAELQLGTIRLGFSLTLPATYADGNPHQLRVITRSGQTLPGSPVTVLQPAAGIDHWLENLPIPAEQHQLLQAMTKRWQQYVPLSLDFSSYPDWLAPHSAVPAPETASALLVIVHGCEDPAPTFASLLAQAHSKWQCLWLGAKHHLKPFAADKRFAYTPTGTARPWLEKHAATSAGIALIEAGDTLPTPHALGHAAAALADPQMQLAYSDCDQIEANERLMPWFKPDYCPDLAAAQPLLNHLCLFRTALARQLADDPATWPQQLAARLADQPVAIRHIPRVLYRCRTSHPTTPRPVVWPDPPCWPSVTLIIPTRDKLALLKPCIESLRKTDYPDYRILVVDNDSRDPATLDYLHQIESAGVDVKPWPADFNFAAINNAAVAYAPSEMVCLVNNDIEAHDPGWLKAMVRQILRPGVGAVGAKLLWPNGMVQHAGMLLGLHGLVGHMGNLWHANDPGYFGLNQITRSVSGVTAACLLCRKADYLAVGGMDADHFAVAFNDVDLCLKLREAGHRIIWCAEAVLTHAESASRGKDDNPAKQARLEKEKFQLRQRWGKQLYRDPYYNPNLNLDGYSHTGLAIPPVDTISPSSEHRPAP